ncbi:MAG: PLP-dependent aminotransferase family protein [Coriobacteriales bacterium]|nr:PLP-dependent aminotransferase family protein [Coriobacteriales bacterium]
MPLYRQIYEQVKNLIYNGSYQAGSKLVPIRRLAEELKISRNTVEAAYLQLTSEGYVSSRTGSGFTVEALELEKSNAQSTPNRNSEEFLDCLQQAGIWSANSDQTDSAKSVSLNSTGIVGQVINSADCQSKAIYYDFTYGDLENRSFPSQIWRKLTAEVLSNKGDHLANSYTDRLGERGLRSQIANYLHINAGVNCHPAQIVIQPGTQLSLHNLLTLFDPFKDIVAMEQPGYKGVISVIKNNHFKIFPIPVYDGNDAIIEALYNSHARLAFMTPSNQFPLGEILPMVTRQRLLRWAIEKDTFIIEDDYCREYRYNTSPLPSLQALDNKDRVIYMGTFSKAISPSLRLNYLVLPPDLLFEWNRVFDHNYAAVPWLIQAVLEEYMKQGFWEKRLRKMQTVNKRKFLTLKNALRKHMGSRVDIRESGSGLHLLVGDKLGRNQSTLIDLAKEQGVSVYETNCCWLSDQHPMQNYVLVGFSAIPEADIESGIKLLANAWFAD